MEAPLADKTFPEQQRSGHARTLPPAPRPESSAKAGRRDAQFFSQANHCIRTVHETPHTMASAEQSTIRKCSRCRRLTMVNKDMQCKECEASIRAEAQGPSRWCGTCISKLKEGEDVLSCEACGKWFHRECENVNMMMYKAVCEKKPGKFWYCVDCKPQMLKSRQRRRGHENRMKKAAAPEEEKPEVEIDPRAALLKLIEEKVEEAEKEKRKTNLLFHNLPESNKELPFERQKDDIQECKTLIKKKLNVKKFRILKVTRLGKQVGNQARPALVKFKEEKHKWKVLKSAKVLKDETDPKYRNVGIVPDLTPKEREEYKTLRGDLKRKQASGERGWQIKKGELVRDNEVPVKRKRRRNRKK